MDFTFEERPSDSSLVDLIWRTESEGGGSFTSIAESRWGLVVTRQVGKTTLTIRGPETKAMPAPVPVDAEFLGINFKLGTYMPQMPVSMLVDCEMHLPEAASKSFWLHGSVWQFPTFENADTFIARMIREGLLMRDSVVDDVLQERAPNISVRTVRRRFLHATGLTHKTIQQIKRARQAVALLESGVSILDTVYEAGYFDQSHLTHSLKYYMGRTPAEILRVSTSP